MTQRASESIEIFSSGEGGWEPERELIGQLLKRMAVAGLRSDWGFCSALSKYTLLFCDNLADTKVIEARRKTGRHRWELFTDSGLKLRG